MQFRPLLSALGLALTLGLALPAAVEAQTSKPKASATKKKSAKTARVPKPAATAKGTAKAAGSPLSPGMKAAEQAQTAHQSALATQLAAVAALKAAGQAAPSSADVLAQAGAADWREPDPQHLVLFEFGEAGAPRQVWMELAPQFAPAHASNIQALVRAAYFDGLAVLRVQDNFVTQWGDPGEPAMAESARRRALPAGAQAKLPAEFDRALTGLKFDLLPELDGWASLNGFVDGFAVAADPAKTADGRAWLAHCYGVVGAGRGNEVDSSNGTSLYAIIGHAPRALDLNITVVGRILKGMEHLAALPRGSAAMGFTKADEARLPLLRARLLADVPAAERPKVQVLRTDTPTWQALQHSRRHRSGWYVASSGRVDLCSTSVPVRVTAPAP